MKKLLKSFAVILLSVCLVNAQMPPLNIQGRLTDPAGLNKEGSFKITFRIFNAATGGLPLWSETQPAVSVRSGIYQAFLGQTSAQAQQDLETVFTTDQELFLEMQIENDGPMVPRQKIGGVGLALRAVRADKLGNDAVVVSPLNGNVGVGMSPSPDKLAVAGTIHSTVGGFRFPDGTVQTSANTGQWQGGGSGVISYSGGNVGIGTTAPLNVLDVRSKGDNSGITVTHPQGYPVAVLAQENSQEGALTLYNGPSQTVSFQGSGPNFITSGGLGLGTMSPAGWLDVGDSFYTSAGTIFVRPQVQGSSEGGEITLQGSGGANGWNMDNFAGHFRWHHDGAEYIRITPDGRVGIGTSGPDATSALTASGGHTGVIGFAVFRGADFSAGGQGSVGVRAHGRSADYVAYGPGLDFRSESSARWKTNITPINKALDKVLQLRGVYFDWDAQHGGGHDVGMLGEEVLPVFPEIVSKNENGEVEGMDYSRMTAVLVEAIKELKRENDSLRNRIETLEKR